MHCSLAPFYFTRRKRCKERGHQAWIWVSSTKTFSQVIRGFLKKYVMSSRNSRAQLCPHYQCWICQEQCSQCLNTTSNTISTIVIWWARWDRRLEFLVEYLPLRLVKHGIMCETVCSYIIWKIYPVHRVINKKVDSGNQQSHHNLSSFSIQLPPVFCPVPCLASCKASWVICNLGFPQQGTFVIAYIWAGTWRVGVCVCVCVCKDLSHTNHIRFQSQLTTPDTTPKWPPLGGHRGDKRWQRIPIWVMWCLEVQQTYSAKARGSGGAGGAGWAIATGNAIVTGGTRGTLQQTNKGTESLNRRQSSGTSGPLVGVPPMGMLFDGWSDDGWSHVWYEVMTVHCNVCQSVGMGFACVLSVFMWWWYWFNVKDNKSLVTFMDCCCLTSG